MNFEKEVFLNSKIECLGITKELRTKQISFSLPVELHSQYDQADDHLLCTFPDRFGVEIVPSDDQYLNFYLTTTAGSEDNLKEAFDWICEELFTTYRAIPEESDL